MTRYYNTFRRLRNVENQLLFFESSVSFALLISLSVVYLSFSIYLPLTRSLLHNLRDNFFSKNFKIKLHSPVRFLVITETLFDSFGMFIRHFLARGIFPTKKNYFYEMSAFSFVIYLK